MDLSYAESQTIIKDTAKRLFENENPLQAVRELEASDLGYSEPLWEQMAGLGFLGLTYPKELGGEDASFLDLYVIYEEMGRHLVPSPHMSTVVQAGMCLQLAGTNEQKARYLPSIADGSCIISPAFLESAGTYGTDGVSCSFEQDQQAGRLKITGTKVLVPYANSARYLLCTAKDAQRDGDIRLIIVERSSELDVNPTSTISGANLHTVDFDGAPLNGELIGEGSGWDTFLTVQEHAAVLQCAEITGAAERVLAMSVDYAQNRVQFGRPIGQFQAVQYLCTDIAIAMHLTTLVSRQAAWAISEGLPFQREAAIAKAYASKAIQLVVRQAHEVFAGAAFMMEHDMQLFTRRARNWQLNFGDSRHNLERLAEITDL